ncbi:hypothetical protein KDL45_00385 [bacterium]|nr:hypothetical protein [bacterium]
MAAKQTIMLLAEPAGLPDRIAGFLGEMGFTTRFCPFPHEALEFATQLSPAVVLADEFLLEQSDPLLPRRFHEHPLLRRLPFVILADQQNARPRVNPNDSAIHAIVPKVSNAMDLYNTVLRALKTEPKPTGTDGAFATPTLSETAPAEPVRRQLVPEPVSTNDTPQPVADITLARLMLHLARRHATGVLEIRKGPLGLRIGIEDGSVRQVVNLDQGGEAFGKLLMRNAIITPLEHRASLKRAEQSGVSQGEALVRMALLNQETMNEFVAQHKREMLGELCGTEQWLGGRYLWREGRRLKVDNEALSQSAMHVVRNGILRRLRPEWIVEAFRRRGAATEPMSLREGAREIFAELGLTREMIAAADGLEGQNAVGLFDRGTRSSNGHEALRLAFLLLIADALAV